MYVLQLLWRLSLLPPNSITISCLHFYSIFHLYHLLNISYVIFTFSLICMYFIVKLDHTYFRSKDHTLSFVCVCVSILSITVVSLIWHYSFRFWPWMKDVVDVNNNRLNEDWILSTDMWWDVIEGAMNEVSDEMGCGHISLLVTGLF